MPNNSQHLKAHIPIYLGMTKLCQMFDLNKKIIYEWLDQKQVRYVVVGHGKNAKKRFYTNDILRIVQKEQYGGENIPESEK